MWKPTASRQNPTRHRILLECSSAGCFTYCPPLLLCYGGRLEYLQQTLWSTKPELSILWSFTGNICWLLDTCAELPLIVWKHQGSLSSIILVSSKSGKHQTYQPLHSMSLPQGQQDAGLSARSWGAPLPLYSPCRLLPVLGKEVPPACCHCWKVSKTSSFQVVRANKQLKKYLFQQWTFGNKKINL